MQPVLYQGSRGENMTANGADGNVSATLGLLGSFPFLSILNQTNIAHRRVDLQWLSDLNDSD